MRGQIGKTVTPCAPPGESPASEESDSKLAPMDIISKTSGVHVLAHSEEEVGQLAWGPVKILGSFYFDCLL